MSMKAGLKAGGIGAAVGLVFGLLLMVPVLGCICCLVFFLILIGAGILAAKFSPAPRSSGGTAGVGAIAGLLSGLGFGVGTTITDVVQASTGATAAAIPQMMQFFQELGINIPSIDTSFAASTPGAVLSGSLCCIGALVIGAGLGAVGGAIGAAIFKQN